MYRFTCLARVAPARDYSLARVALAKKSFPSQGGLIANCVQVHVGEKKVRMARMPSLPWCICMCAQVGVVAVVQAHSYLVYIHVYIYICASYDGTIYIYMCIMYIV